MSENKTYNTIVITDSEPISKADYEDLKKKFFLLQSRVSNLEREWVNKDDGSTEIAEIMRKIRF